MNEIELTEEQIKENKRNERLKRIGIATVIAMFSDETQLSLITRDFLENAGCKDDLNLQEALDFNITLLSLGFMRNEILEDKRPMLKIREELAKKARDLSIIGGCFLRIYRRTEHMHPGLEENKKGKANFLTRIFRALTLPRIQRFIKNQRDLNRGNKHAKFPLIKAACFDAMDGKSNSGPLQCRP